MRSTEEAPTPASGFPCVTARKGQSADDLKTSEALIDDEMSIKRGRDLIVGGYEFRKLCFVKDGYAVRYKLLRNGKRQILNVLLPGDLVEYRAAFSSAPSTPSPPLPI